MTFAERVSFDIYASIPSIAWVSLQKTPQTGLGLRKLLQFRSSPQNPNLKLALVFKRGA